MKSVILNHVAEGLYTVRTDYQNARIAAEIIRLDARIANIDAIIDDPEKEELHASAKMLKLNLQKRRQYLSAQPASLPVKQIWCASLDETLSGVVDVAVVNDGKYNVLALPSPPIASIVKPIMTTPAAAAFNFAVHDFWQKHYPMYRYGRITSINYDQGTANVTLESESSRYNNYSINAHSTLAAVVIEYQCVAAFVVGDNVLIKFADHDWTKPTIIGFKSHPKGCGLHFVFGNKYIQEQYWEWSNEFDRYVLRTIYGWNYTVKRLLAASLEDTTTQMESPADILPEYRQFQSYSKTYDDLCIMATVYYIGNFGYQYYYTAAYKGRNIEFDGVGTKYPTDGFAWRYYIEVGWNWVIRWDAVSFDIWYENNEYFVSMMVKYPDSYQTKLIIWKYHSGKLAKQSETDISLLDIYYETLLAEGYDMIGIVKYLSRLRLIGHGIHGGKIKAYFFETQIGRNHLFIPEMHFSLTGDLTYSGLKTVYNGVLSGRLEDAIWNDLTRQPHYTARIDDNELEHVGAPTFTVTHLSAASYVTNYISLYCGCNWGPGFSGKECSSEFCDNDPVPGVSDTPITHNYQGFAYNLPSGTVELPAAMFSPSFIPGVVERWYLSRNRVTSTFKYKNRYPRSMRIIDGITIDYNDVYTQDIVSNIDYNNKEINHYTGNTREQKKEMKTESALSTWNITPAGLAYKISATKTETNIDLTAYHGANVVVHSSSQTTTDMSSESGDQAVLFANAGFPHQYWEAILLHGTDANGQTLPPEIVYRDGVNAVFRGVNYECNRAFFSKR
jgi:hypothetical protein